MNIDALKDEDVFGAFSYLLSRITKIFAKLELTELKTVCMARGMPLPREFQKEVKKAENLDDILDMFNNTIYCNWLNVRLLKVIANNIDDKRAVKVIKMYEDNVYSRKVSDVKSYLSLFCFDENTVSKIEVEINKSHEGLTLKEAVQVSESLEKILKTYPSSVSLAGSNPGCLRITVMIPLHCSLYAFEMAKKNFLKLRQFHIQYLEIESFPKIFALNCSDNDSSHAIVPSKTPTCKFHFSKLCTYV